MSEWKQVPARSVMTQRKDVVTLEPGVEYRTMGVRWYGKGAYDRGIGTTSTIKAKRLFRAHEGDFVFNRIDTQNGAFDVVPTVLDGALATNEFPLYVADPDQLSERFLLLYFQQPSVLAQIDAMRAGSEGRSRWKEADFEAWRIPLPSPAEQRRIVDIVASVDVQIQSVRCEQESAIEVARRARLALLSVGVRGEWQSELTDSHTSLTWTEELPAGWSRETIGSVSVVRSGATPRRSEQARYFDAGSIPWVKTGDLNERLISETDESITDVGFAESSVRLLPGDTILVAMYGGFGQIGRTARLGSPATTNQAISALTDLRADVIPAYLHQALKAGRPKWRLVAASSRKDPNISKRDVENFDFPLPRPDEQQEIADILEKMESATDMLAEELTHLRAFRSALLTSLLNQEIEIPESYDRLLEKVS